LGNRVRAHAVITVVAAALTVGACSDPAAPPPSDSFTHPQGVLFATRPLSGRPYGVAISSTGVVYAARLDVDSVSRANLPDTLITAAVAVGDIPSHVAFNPAGTRAYVANQGSNNVSVVNVASGTVIGNVPVSSDAWNVIVSPNGATAYATTDQGSLYFIATASNTAPAPLVLSAGDALRGLALHPGGGTLYVAGRNTGRIYVVNTVSRGVVDTIIVSGVPQRMAVSASGTELYVANEGAGVNFVNLLNGSVFTMPLAAGAYGLALSPDDAQLYVTVPDLGMLMIIDRAQRTKVDSLMLGGRPRTVAFSRLGESAVVSNENSLALHFIR
jgi:YVTN family beta-propeller protein